MKKISKAQTKYIKRFNEISKKLHGEKACIPLDQPNESKLSENISKITIKRDKNGPNSLKNLLNKKHKPIKKTKKNLNKSEKLKLYKYFDSYLAKINFEKKDLIGCSDKNSSSVINSPQMVIILDVSGSMSDHLSRFTKTIIPEILNSIYGSDTSYSICLITFSDDVNVYEGNAEQISQFNIDPFGGTEMAQSIEKFYDFIKNKKYANKIYRILTLSDGMLFDQEETMASADKLKSLFNEENLVVNSQSVRLLTGCTEPDTRGLSSMLQLSTLEKPKLIDIDCNQLNDTEIAKTISDLFINDGLGYSAIFKNDLEEDCLMEEPWGPCKNSIYLFPGNNSFWIKLKETKEDICKTIEKNFVIEHKDESITSIKCVLADDISINNYQELIKDKIDFYFNQLKVLKIINTQESIEKMDKIIDFFNKLEENIFSRTLQPQNSTQFKLYERTQAIKSIIRRRQLSLANKMREIRNDDKVNQLNARQQAEYLREININEKGGKNLAKRAMSSEVDFDEIIRKEAKQIADHIKELDSVDESKLTVSFYSTCNTLDGIKAVCNLYHEAQKENIFNEITANDIIKIINIVGVAANAPIGNYPDPMTYRINTLYPGTFVSLSDILIAYETTNGQNLKEIGSKNEIITSIPYFEDEKIGYFLVKYAPKLLEYCASIGMRRIMADILYTNEYTLIAGVWSMIPILLKDKKEINIKIFLQLCKSYLIVAGNHFDYVLNLLEKQKKMDKDGLSLYIANNGLTNMTSPLIKYMKKYKGKESDEMIKRIVRACYQFEIYQFTRKDIRAQKTDDPEKYVRKTLIDLLKIKLEKDKTVVTKLYEANPEEPVFSDKYEINEDKLNSIMKRIWWADYITIYPLFLKASLSEEPISEFKKIEINNITEELMQERLGINFNSKLFKLYCVVQGYLKHEQAERYDIYTEKMKIIDLGIQENAEKYVKDYIRNLFKEKYEKELKEKAKKEKEDIAKTLAKKIVESRSISEFISLLKNGIKIGVIEYKITDHLSLGFEDIITNISIKDKKVPYRKEKINIIMTGKDEKENDIWGKDLKIRRIKMYYPLKNVLNKEEWNDLIKSIQKRGIHVYRKNKNRQGHDNGLMSYWAMGYNSIKEMMENVSKEEFEKYAKEHRNCCGFYKGEYTIMRRYEKGMGVTKRRKEKRNGGKSENIINDTYYRKGCKNYRGTRGTRGRGIYRGRSRGRGRGRGI